MHNLNEGVDVRQVARVYEPTGCDGAEAVVQGDEIKVPAIPVNVKDTTAAGDCFVGVLASALDRGLSLEAAMRRASAAAVIACSRPGSQSSIPFAAETDQWISRRHRESPHRIARLSTRFSP
ncbi:PfkB family carbohydrate kinase [Mesorhizobium sp.]|uniref:PfkB family carbohydrate kinase n=1 Tax=Mesorhizobium sp. TaxID=1871066 RepID=UPI00257B17B2|nr:PfkB family carbohydrate kinase [Mesorhizobium sp.]